MTSAPNHQQLLSGNKGIFLFLISILLFSCGAILKSTTETSETTQQENVEVDTLETKAEVPAVEAPKETEVVEQYETVHFKGAEFKVPTHKKEFKIAVILPFHLGYKDPQETVRANLMLEYYQGINVALKQMEELGSKFKIHVYDSKNDTIFLKRILRKPELSKMDMIIGPTDQKQVRIAAHFARKHKIPLFSPITIINNSWSENPYLFNLKPSDQMKAEEFMKYYMKAHKEKRLVIVRSGSRFDKGFGQALINFIEAHPVVDYKVVDGYREQNWEAALSAGSNLVIHTSEDRTELNTAVTSLMEHKERVVLVGSERWLDYTGVDYSFWNQLNVHFIASDLAEQGNTQSNEMKSVYRSMYHGDPSAFAYAGYDQMLFAAELLDAFGKHFPVFVANKSFEYANNIFNLSKSNNCYHNRSLVIYGFKDFALVPVKN